MTAYIPCDSLWQAMSTARTCRANGSQTSIIRTTRSYTAPGRGVTCNVEYGVKVWS